MKWTEKISKRSWCRYCIGAISLCSILFKWWFWYFVSIYVYCSKQLSLTNLSCSLNITFPDPFSFKGCYYTLMYFSCSLSTAMVSGSECCCSLQNTCSVISSVFYDWLAERSREYKNIEPESHFFFHFWGKKKQT